MSKIIIHDEETNELVNQLVFQCAPVIAGIKVSNLLTINKKNKEQLNQHIFETGISLLCLHENNDKLFYLMYRQDVLEKHLTNIEVINFLSKYGYNDNFNDMLCRLKGNFVKFYLRDNIFPHEIGMFLGYPIEDVKAFIENKGKGCIFTGYWKVYNNPEQAQRIFELYNKVRSDATIAILNGYTLIDFINSYRNSILSY